MSRLALALLLLAAPVAALADDGQCLVPLEVTQKWEGRQIMVSVVVELQSPGDGYVCVRLPANAAAVNWALRRQLPNRLGVFDPLIDSCVSVVYNGAHPVDGFSRVQIRDDAGSYRCVWGPDDDDNWGIVPRRKQIYEVTWYWTP